VARPLVGVDGKKPVRLYGADDVPLSLGGRKQAADYALSSA